MDSTSPYQIHYAALQTRILAFQTTIYDFLQLYCKSASIFDDELATATTQQLEHNYHTLVAEIQQYQQQLQFLEKTSTITDNALAPHQPISLHPHQSQYTTNDTCDYDIDLRVFNQDDPDVELQAVLDHLTQTDIPYNPNPLFSNIYPTNFNTTTISPPIPYDIVPQSQQQYAQITAQAFNLSNCHLSVPIISIDQGTNIPLPLHQPTATEGSLIHSFIIIKKLTNLTLQCDRISHHFQSIANFSIQQIK